MKLFVRYFAVLTLALFARAAFAQTGFSETVTSYKVDKSQNTGNDFWFAPIQNYVDTGTSKYILVYVASLTSTTAFIEYAGHIESAHVPAGGRITFNIPLTAELKSSGVVEKKAIHVWSPADISVYLMSHYAYSGDGMYCLPTSDLDTDYVAVGYESLWEGFGVTTPDMPSEFTITATRDNTEVEITPATDLRQSSMYPTNANSVAYPKGIKFTVPLNRGEAVQYQALFPSDGVNFDITGTIIHSTSPVAVVAGAMMANIPADFDYGDHICEMMTPVQAWGKTYYVTNPVQPQGMSGHDFSLYCIISSVPNQTIYRCDNATGNHTEAVLGPKYDHNYIEEESANRWSSDAPFMLVQYLNSSTYPDNVNGNGDPAEVVINPVESYTKSVFFQTPTSVGAQAPFDNYVNVIVNVNDRDVTFDAKNIKGYTSQPTCGQHKIYIIPHVVPGAHQIISDSGVGVYAYGYGYDESNAWAGSLGTRFMSDTLSNDTVPPAVSFVKDSLCLHIVLADSGSGLDEIIADSESNVTLSYDSTFIPGVAHSFADVCVVDPLKTGYLHMWVTDESGNTSVATIIYTHPPIVSAPGFTLTSSGFDSVLLGTHKTLPILTITDTSTQYPITIDKVWTEASEFILDGGLAANKLPISLSPLASHSFIITFNPHRDSVYACPAFASSSEYSIERVDTLKGIGYSLSGVQQEPQTKFSVSLEPNPATKSLTLSYSLPLTAEVTFMLSAMNGKTVIEWNLDAENAGQHIKGFDISSLASGSYIYRLESNGQVISGKLIINR